MKRVAAFVGVVLLSSVSSALAQTEGRVSVGGSITFVKPTDNDVKSVLGGGPLVRLNPRKGWGVAGALNWFRADLENPSGAGGEFARLRVRPLMAGVSYTVGNQPTLVSFSIVAGPSFNKFSFEDGFLIGLPTASRPTADVETSFAVRPGVGVTFTVAPRVAIVGFGGYMINRPDIVYRDVTGQEYRNRWKADAAVLSVGAVYSLF
jgi:Outer membrane protein beta-barrel domain